MIQVAIVIKNVVEQNQNQNQNHQVIRRVIIHHHHQNQIIRKMIHMMIMKIRKRLVKIQMMEMNQNIQIKIEKILFPFFVI
jgi:hypothetical protein